MKTPVFSKLKGYLFLAFFIPFTSLCALGAIISSYIDRRGGLVHRHASFWGRTALLAGRVSLAVEGAERIPADPVIFMSNHQGAFDIPALLRAIPCRFSWLAKKELFSIPLFGRAMAAAGYLPVDREHGRRALESIRRAANAIRGGTSVAIFPEGTRSETGDLLPFKRGGFILAAMAEVPIVPVVISGSRAITPPRTLSIFPGTIRVRFLPPLMSAGKTADQLSAEVRRVMGRELAAP
jgi:1-acyl-sn-glycerol-3-phosphate acyltransferase